MSVTDAAIHMDVVQNTAVLSRERLCSELVFSRENTSDHSHGRGAHESSKVSH